MREQVGADVTEATGGHFHAPGGDVEVPTMTVTAELGYARTGGWQTVVLPAKSGVEVLVLLPDEELAQPHPAAFDVPGSTAVALSLPKVDVREKFELREALEQVGVGTMFSPDADLSGLSPEPLFVSEVVHVDRPFLLAVRHARSKASRRSPVRDRVTPCRASVSRGEIMIMGLPFCA